MKKSIKILLYITGCLLILIISLLTFYLTVTARANINQEKLINVNNKIIIYDNYNNQISEETERNSITPIENIKDYTKNAFIAIEDKRFNTHHGVDYKGIIRATFNNIKSFSFKEGASTITQQLIKNTHLSNDKSIIRKLKEIKLAKQLEKKYTKNQILESYLNTIYFGDSCYGITNASKHYFNKLPQDLSIAESASLAAIIKAPSIYSPTSNFEKNNTRKNLVLKNMFEQNYISETEFYESKNEKLEIKNENKNFGYNYLVKKQLTQIFSDYDFYKDNIKIYTYFEPNIQNFLDLKFDDKYLESQIVMTTQNKILAYKSNIGEVNRQLGSTIKPLLVYAPALELGNVYSCTKITDKKINYNGYSPSNYNDKYYGTVSIKESLAKSLNTCAVQLFNDTGIEKSVKYLENLPLNITEEDKNLSLALGATKYGSTLLNITSSYSSLNDGNFYNPTLIKYIEIDGKIIYKDKNHSIKIFNQDTSSIMKDILEYTACEGTGKKLSNLPFPVCTKTGTVGNENGNTDVYNISFNNDYIIGCWIGNRNSLLENNITGGTKPTNIAYEIWNNLYKNKVAPKEIFKPGITKIGLDNISYTEEDKILLADELSPERYIKYEFFGKNRPTIYSDRFSNPKITETPKYVVNNNRIDISLCQTKYVNYKVYERHNDIKKEIYDSLTNNKTIISLELNNGAYIYSFIPYFKNGDDTIFGNEIEFAKIKSSLYSNDDWWLNN